VGNGSANARSEVVDLRLMAPHGGGRLVEADEPLIETLECAARARSVACDAGRWRLARQMAPRTEDLRHWKPERRPWNE